MPFCLLTGGTRGQIHVALTVGFTSNWPMTVNIRESPTGVHTAEEEKIRKTVICTSNTNFYLDVQCGIPHITKFKRTAGASNSNKQSKACCYHMNFEQEKHLSKCMTEFFVNKEHHIIRYLNLTQVIIYSKHVAPEAMSTLLNSAVPGYIPGH